MPTPVSSTGQTTPSSHTTTTQTISSRSTPGIGGSRSFLAPPSQTTPQLRLSLESWFHSISSFFTGAYEQLKDSFQCITAFFQSLMGSARSKNLNPSPRAGTGAITFESYPISPHEKGWVREIIQTVGRGNFAALCNSTHLEALGERIEHIHPFRFLECIFTDRALVTTLDEIHRSSVPIRWHRILEGISQKMDREFQAQSLIPCLQGFADSLGLSVDSLRPLIEHKQWKEFVLYLLDQKMSMVPAISPPSSSQRRNDHPPSPGTPFEGPLPPPQTPLTPRHQETLNNLIRYYRESRVIGHNTGQSTPLWLELQTAAPLDILAFLFTNPRIDQVLRITRAQFLEKLLRVLRNRETPTPEAFETFYTQLGSDLDLNTQKKEAIGLAKERNDWEAILNILKSTPRVALV